MFKVGKVASYVESFSVSKLPINRFHCTLISTKLSNITEIVSKKKRWAMDQHTGQYSGTCFYDIRQ